MKRLSMAFVFALVAAMAFPVIAADVKYEADLSGVKIPPVATRATGEVDFTLILSGVGGSGTGGFGLEEHGTRGLGEERPDSRVLNEGGIEGEGAGGAMMGDALRYKMSVRDIENLTAAHLHAGKRTDAEGPVIASLYTGPKKAGKFSGDLVEGVIRDQDLKGPLAGKSIQELVRLIDEGKVYVNVHTDKHPAGEIRGQVTKEG